MTEEEIDKLMQKTGIPWPYKFRIIKVTTEFMALDKDDIILLDHIPYLILRNEREIGFGLDNEPKYWVKRTTNLKSGKLQIVKLVYFEKFIQTVGDIKIRFFRNPNKEADALEVSAEHPDFMKGHTVRDIMGNLVRIIEYIPGKTLNQIDSPISLNCANWLATNHLNNNRCILRILYGPSYAEPGESASDFLKNKTVSLSALKKAITQIGFTAERIEVKFVEPTKKEPLSSVILKEALNSKCKFLLIGKHYLSKAQEFVFGDTAINIIRKSTIPVIVVTSEMGLEPN